MADTPVCLLLPGTLCDARLFAPLQAAWAALGHAPALRVAFRRDDGSGGIWRVSTTPR